MPTLFEPKWFNSNYDLKVVNIKLFLKSDKDFKNFFYAKISTWIKSKDGKVR